MTDIMPEGAMERLAARAGWAIQDECGVTSKPWSDEGMRAALAVLDEMGLTPTSAASLMAGEAVVVPAKPTMRMRVKGQGWSTPRDTYLAMIAAAQQKDQGS